MNKNIVKGLLLCLCLLVVTGTASAATIDFEDVSVNQGSHIIVDSFVSHGFHFSQEVGHIDVGDRETIFAYNGNQYGFVHHGSFAIDMVDTLGDPFSIVSFDAAEFWNPKFHSNANASEITLSGITTTGETVTETFELDGIIDGPNGADDFQNFVVTEYFHNLVSAQFIGLNGLTGASFGIDNIVSFSPNSGDGPYEPPAPVPEPGTLLLMGSGLIGLAGYTRHKKRT